MIPGSSWTNCESDQILVPVSGGYRTCGLLNLLGFSRRMLRSTSGFGLSPLHFISQRGPLQDGETPLDMRFDTRTIQIVVAETLCSRTDYWDRRWDLLDLLRPNRSFDGTVRPLIYRKWLPAGKIQRGSDLVTENGSDAVVSLTARFIERDLQVGQPFTITSGADAGTYTILDVPNDYELQLNANMTATVTGVGWRYQRGWGKRDLYCLLEQGPTFDEGPGASPFYPTGYHEALRFVAHDPMWYGLEQTQAWTLVDISGLVFDGIGGWTGNVPGMGEWVFAAGYIGQTISVPYWGTVRARPTFTIHGPVEDPTIANVTTGDQVDMDYTVGATETVTIDTLALTVMNDATPPVNLMPYTSGDLATLGLEPPPQAPNRVNDMYITFAGGIAAATVVTMYWENRYAGI